LEIDVVMTFKVIITHPSEEGDEHTYYGIAFLKPGNVKSKRLEYSDPKNRLEAELVYDGSPIKVGDKFLAMLIPVDEGETIKPPLYKFGENHPAPQPEEVNFP
jgi:hypothetical protein